MPTDEKRSSDTKSIKFPGLLAIIPYMVSLVNPTNALF
jgi:hypothetical protein